MRTFLLPAALVMSLPILAQPAMDGLSPEQVQAAVQVWQGYAGAETMIKLIKQNHPDGKTFGLNVVNAFKASVAKAKAAGLSDSYLIPRDGGRPAISLGDIQKELASLEGTASAAKQQADAEVEAKLAPYTKLLSGDKLRIFKETFKLQLKCYGEGGKLLETPQDYAKARVWATVGHPPGFVQPHWDLGAYHFNGMKLIKKTTAEGVGDRPPASAFAWKG